MDETKLIDDKHIPCTAKTLLVQPIKLPTFWHKQTDATFVLTETWKLSHNKCQSNAEKLN